MLPDIGIPRSGTRLAKMNSDTHALAATGAPRTTQDKAGAGRPDPWSRVGQAGPAERRQPRKPNGDPRRLDAPRPAGVVPVSRPRPRRAALGHPGRPRLAHLGQTPGH